MLSYFQRKIQAANPIGIFACFMVSLLFLPRLVTKGMFGDGLLYASMARNLSEGRGSMWAPFFSKSYWLENIPTVYYENPPMMLWLESLLFRLCGDHWWVEKLFCIPILCINIFLLISIWKEVFRTDPQTSKFAALVIIFWYLTPVVIWGNVNNMMDNNLLIWCLLAILFIFKSFSSANPILHLILAGISIFFGILTKGPVALYPMAFPFLHYLFTRQHTFYQMIKQTAVLVSTTFVAFIILLYTVDDAMLFFKNYWETRLLAVITGNRSDMKLTGWDRVYILFELIKELSVIFGLVTIGYVYTKYKKIKVPGDPKIQSLVWTFLFTGLGATLPILVSTKQSGIYLLPGLPMFAIAASLMSVRFLSKIFDRPNYYGLMHKVNYFSFVGIIGVFVFSAFTFGQPGREQSLVTGIESMINTVPKGSQIGVCPKLKKDFVIHTYMQRMGQYEMYRYNNQPYFLTIKGICDNLHTTINTQDFKEIWQSADGNMKLFDAR